MNEGKEYSRTDATESEYTDIRPDPEETGKWVSVLVVLVGVWLIAEAFLMKPVIAGLSGDIAVAVALVALGGYNYVRRSDGWLGSVAVGAIITFLGIWLVTAAFINGSMSGVVAIETGSEFWSDIVTGLITTSVGAYSAYKALGTNESTEAAPT
jgi:hypothetical protein